MSNRRIWFATMLVCLACGAGTDAARGQSFSGTAGPNLGAAPSQPPLEVIFSTEPPAHWQLQMDLIVDPIAGPMIKHFQSPRQATGAPILLDAQQPFPQVVWEDFLILPVPGTAGTPVTDWHEEILTPGWEWVIPGDVRFPSLFPPNSSLITRNGQPWPWSPIPMPTDPTKLWVRFPPIPPNNVLDVHKALLWVGTDGNRIWGDGTLNDGTTFDESFIRVREYPTIPEPATFALASLAGVMAWSHALRRKRQF